jgi:uncharacterized membrane protein YeaQ/YmgE (transglycosylase-associated protein family)
MGIIARVFPGRASALLAGHLLLGRRAQGLAVAYVIGIAGALLRGWTPATCSTWPPAKPPNPAID